MSQDVASLSNATYTVRYSTLRRSQPRLTRYRMLHLAWRSTTCRMRQLLRHLRHLLRHHWRMRHGRLRPLSLRPQAEKHRLGESIFTTAGVVVARVCQCLSASMVTGVSRYTTLCTLDVELEECSRTTWKRCRCLVRFPIRSVLVSFCSGVGCSRMWFTCGKRKTNLII